MVHEIDAQQRGLGWRDAVGQQAAARKSFLIKREISFVRCLAGQSQQAQVRQIQPSCMNICKDAEQPGAQRANRDFLLLQPESQRLEALTFDLEGADCSADQKGVKRLIQCNVAARYEITDSIAAKVVKHICEEQHLMQQRAMIPDHPFWFTGGAASIGYSKRSVRGYRYLQIAAGMVCATVNVKDLILFVA